MPFFFRGLLVCGGESNQRQQGAPIGVFQWWKTQQVEQGGPDVHVFGARFDHQAGVQAEGKGKDEGYFRDLSVDVASVALEASLPKGFAVIRGDDHERLVEHPGVGHVTQDVFHHSILASDRVVVDVRVGIPEERRFFVVGVLVDVHQVDVEEPALVGRDVEEGADGLDGAVVGPLALERWVLALHRRRYG